jgi:hypothetical protein
MLDLLRSSEPWGVPCAPGWARDDNDVDGSVPRDAALDQVACVSERLLVVCTQDAEGVLPFRKRGQLADGIP